MEPELTRRTFALVGLAGVLAACGSSSGSSRTDTDTTTGTGVDDDDPEFADTTPDDTTSDADTTPGTTDPVEIADPVAVAERQPGGDPQFAGTSITAFGFDMFGAVSTTHDAGDDVTISPASIAIALAMLEPGAVNAARDELRAILSIDDAETFHASMDGLEQDLESRTTDDSGSGDPGEITMRIANAAFLQRGYPFEAAYLDTIGRFYGPVLEELDTAADPDAARERVNTFVSDATEGRIPELLAPGTVSPATVLMLVNALFLTASWFVPFDRERTEPTPFTTLDGTVGDVDMMSGSGTTSHAGDGWVGATKVHVGRITSQFVLPDDGRFAEIGERLAATFDELDTTDAPGGTFQMPTFETRVNSPLVDPLKAIGLDAIFATGNLLGIADDPSLLVDSVVHEAFVKYDEDGVEAAAATVVAVATSAAPAADPVPVTLDRPFYYRIVDQVSGATLFVGRIMDPTT